MGAGGIGEGVRPLAEQRLDEALRLAVGARGIRTGAQVAQAQPGACLAPVPRQVGRTVVREHRLYGHALCPVPGDRAPEEGDSVHRPVGGEHFGVGEPGVIVDRDVDVLPPGLRAAVHAVPQDPLPDMPEAAQFLGIDVQ